MSDVIGDNIDLVSEKYLISALMGDEGYKVWTDVSDIIQPSTFIADSHQNIFAVIDTVFRAHNDVKIDWPLFIGSAYSIGLKDFFLKKEETDYLKEVKKLKSDVGSAKPMAAKLRKLEIARIIRDQLKLCDRQLSVITGEERVADILNIAERPIFDFAQLIRTSDKAGSKLIFSDINKYLDYLEANPVNQIGIKSGLDRWDKAIGGGLIDGSVSVIAARVKQGKALRHGSKVYTPTGPKNIEDIAINDDILTPDNKIAKVIAVSPQGQVDIYRIFFNDNTHVDCCKEHLWKVKFYKDSEYKITNTDFLLNNKLRTDGISKQNRFAIPLLTEINFTKRDIPIDAYLLGLLIGDGSFRGNSPTITSADQYIILYIKDILHENYVLNKIKSKYGYLISKKIRNTFIKNIYRVALEKLNLYGKTSHDKFIPDVYKYNTTEIRWSILQGLMDTDGYVDINGNCSYSTVSIQLANDIQELVNSLGGICKIANKISTCNGKKFPSFVLRITFNDNRKCFRLPRKVERATLRIKPELCRRINKIEYIGKDYATCITIDNNDGLFLTNNHIVTHNSILADTIAYNICKQGIPVLMLDTEMVINQHYNRLLGAISGVDTDKIKTGQYSFNPIWKAKVREAGQILESLPYHYINIAGQEFEETLGDMRRWIMSKVGLEPNGKAKKCVIILDYLKMMSAASVTKNVQEYMALGFQMISFVNFMIRYSIPGVTFLQLNRDGINSEETSAIAGSDRLNWFCSNLSYFKAQSEDEINEQRAKGNQTIYTRKLIPIFAREGSGLDEGDFININFQRNITRITEGPTRFEAERESIVTPNDPQVDFK